MKGMSVYGQKLLDDLDHVKQSITDILTTPIGSRVMRRHYGSRIYEYIDQPANQLTLAKLLNATVEAIDTWEPRVEVKFIDINRNTDGGVIIDVEFIYLPNGSKQNLKGVIV